MSMTNKPVEPSMEEILASIRKIIAEEPIGTRSDPMGYKPKAPVRAETSQKLTPAPEALAIDDVLDMAGGSGLSPAAGARDGAVSGDGAASKSADASWNPGRPAGAATSTATPQTSHAAEAKTATNGAARGDELEPVASERADTFGATVPGRTAEPETTVEQPVAQRVDAALSEAQKRVERHLGSLPDVAERPAPLGLRSIREPARPDASKSATGGGLSARVAAAQAPAEPVAVEAQAALGDKGRAMNGSAGAAATAATAPAKQAESTPAAKTEHVEVRASEAKPAAAAAKIEAHAADPSKTAAGKPSLEEAVAEMLRPMLSTWLDTNLPRIVQDVVREQMAKAPLPGTDKPAG